MRSRNYISNYFSATVLVIAAIFFAYDIITDLASGADSLLHIIVELTVFLAISIVLFQELKRVVTLKRDIHEERSKTARLSGELFSAISKQFSDWGLSKSEQEVALSLPICYGRPTGNRAFRDLWKNGCGRGNDW